MVRTTISNSDIEARIKYAKGLYGTAAKWMQDVEDVFTGEYVIESDLKDEKLTPVVPSKPRAILTKLLAMLAVRATLNLEVIPLSTSEGEERICTKLERWLRGFQDNIQREVRRPLYRDWAFWFLLRGRGDLELRYIPELVGTDKLPLRVLVDDPMTIFPVWGREGIGYYAKVYKVPAWELKGAPIYKGWDMPDVAQKKFDEQVEVQEYWDADWHAALIDGKFVYSKANPLGFVPLAEAQAERTPLASMEWAAQSTLFPIMNALKQQAQLMGKLTNAVDLFYWPRLLCRVPGGKSVVIDSMPGAPINIPEGAEITVLLPLVNQGLMEQLMNWLQSDINLFSIPEIAWGIEPRAVQSGFAISQVLGQVLDRIQDKQESLELAAAWHFGDLLRTVEKFAEKPFEVSVEPEQGGVRRSILAIGTDDVAGHYRVACKILPDLPTDEVLRMRIATMARQPGPDGLPLLPDPYIRREVVRVKDPDVVEEELDAQVMEKTVPAIIMKKQKDYIETWKKEHKVSDEEFDQLEYEAQTLMGQMPPGRQPSRAQPSPTEMPPQAPEEQYNIPLEEPTEEELALIE